VGCGEGDEITFLEKHEGLSNGQAIKRYLELAGVNDGVPATLKSNGVLASPKPDKGHEQNVLDWNSCVDAFTEKWVEWLAKWRGYSDKFCRSLRDRGLIGIYNGCIAFPVHAADGSVIGAHYRSKSGDRWFYTKGCTARPLVIGASIGARHVYLFESYWDAFALIDKLEDEPGLVIITRGAANGALVAGLIPPGATHVFAFKHNDVEKDGRRAGDEWLKNVAMHAAANVRWAKTPEQFKDLNDWTRAGATSDDLIAAIINARKPLDHVRVERSGESEWPDPDPIRNELRPVQKLRDEMIPQPFRHWLRDIAHRMQCPIDFVAAAAIVMASIIIGAGCAIRPKRRDDWLVIPNLWGGAVGRPSMLKTPALAEGLKPLARLEAIAKQEYDAAVKNYLIEVAAYKAEQQAIKGQMVKSARAQFRTADPETARAQIKVYDPEAQQSDLKSLYADLKAPDPPVWRRYKTNDATIEKISEVLAANPRGLLIFRDELIGLLATWDKEGREPDRAFHLEGWNGNGSHTTDRIGRGTIYTPNLCESIFGGVQPSKLITYLYQTVRNIANDGLVQRFQLLVYPDEPKEWQLVDEYPNHTEKNRAFEVIEALAAMDFEQCGAKQEEWARTPYFQFADDAQEFFFGWWKVLETEKLRAADESAVMLEHLGKYRSLLPSLALIFHLIEIANGAEAGPVTLTSTKQAAAWCDYLESHARRIYGLVSDIKLQAASRLAQKIEEGVLHDGFSARDVYRKEWSLLDTKELTQGAIEELVEAGWLREEASRAPENGRPALPIYRINPKLKLAN
jgi:putative DNA primase/helicase